MTCALDSHLSFFLVLTYSCLFARGLCGLSALDFYSRKGAVGFENTSSEVRNLWALTSVGCPCRLLWALTYDHTVGLKQNYEVEKNLFMLFEYLKGDRASCGLLRAS